MSIARTLRASIRLPLDLVYLAFDWLRVALTRLQRLAVRKNKRTCPFCRDTGHAYVNQQGRTCYASRKYGNEWLARGLCSGLRPAEFGDAPFECRFAHPRRGPSGWFFHAGLAVLLAALVAGTILQVRINFFPRAVNKARRVMFGPTLPEGLAADPALRELQLRLLKLSSRETEANPELAAVYEGQGDAHLAEGAVRMARLEYAIATRLNPTNGPLWHKLGQTYLQLGAIPLAQQAFEEEIQAAGASVTAHEALAVTHAIAGRTAPALEHAIASHELAEDGNVVALLELLELYSQRRDITAADEAGEAALARAPDNPLVLSAIAQANVRFRSPRNAEQYFRRALEADPHHQPSLLGLANVLVQQQRTDEAEALVRNALETTPEALPARALSIEIARQREGNLAAIRLLEDLREEHPDYPWAQVRLAELLLFAGEFDRAHALAAELAKSENYRTRWDGLWLQTRMFFAQGLFKKAIEISRPLLDHNQYALEVRMLQAQALIIREDYRAATTLLNDTIRRFPDFHPAYLRLGEALVRLGDPAQAQAIIDRVVEQQQGSASSYKLKGDYYMLSGAEPELAREAYEKAIDADPDNLGLRYDYILLLSDQLGDLSTAAALAETVRETYPNDVAFRDLLGWIRFRGGRVDEALPLLEAAVAAAPRVPVFRHHLGTVYHHLGRTDDARRELRIALALEPGFYGSARARGLLQQMEDR